MSNDFSFFCKAYTIDDVRQFPGWTDGMITDHGDVAAEEIDVVFIHPDYRVTRTVFAPPEGSADAAPDWVAFCRDELGYYVPDDLAPADDGVAAAST